MPNYEYDPKEDITAYELAKIIQLQNEIRVVRMTFGTGLIVEQKISEGYDKLPYGAKKHLVRILTPEEQEVLLAKELGLAKVPDPDEPPDPPPDRDY